MGTENIIDFENTLKLIAGGNAIARDDKTVAKMGKALWYLKIQTKVMNKIEDMEERENYRLTIFENAKDILID